MMHTRGLAPRQTDAEYPARNGRTEQGTVMEQRRFLIVGEDDVDRLAKLARQSGLKASTLDPACEDCPLAGSCRIVAGMRDQLDDRKAIERAKGILMGHLNLSEAKAYEHLKRLAMNQQERIGDVARRILAAERVFMDAVR